MPDVIDGFGEVNMAHYKGKPSNHITERDDGYIRKVPDAQYYFRKYDEWPKYEQEAIKEVKGRVLDIGLGAGRHALYLQEQGHEVVGIDTSPLSIKVASLRGVKDCREMSVHQLDFPPSSFDTVLMLGSNLGLGTVDEIRSYLSRLYEITRPDGIIIGDSRDPLQTEEPHHFAYHERNRNEGKTAGLVRIRVGFEGRLGEWFDLLWMEETLLEEIIAPTGWTASRHYRSDQGSYIAILTKNSNR
jgi:SAM-dependent methyltransferase